MLKPNRSGWFTMLALLVCMSATSCNKNPEPTQAVQEDPSTDPAQANLAQASQYQQVGHPRKARPFSESSEPMHRNLRIKRQPVVRLIRITIRITRQGPNNLISASRFWRPLNHRRRSRNTVNLSVLVRTIYGHPAIGVMPRMAITGCLACG